MFKFKQELKTTEKHKTRQMIFHRPQQPQFRKVNRNSRAPQGKGPGVPLDTFKHPGVLDFPSASVPNVRGENIPVQASPAPLQVSPPALPVAPSSQAPSQQLLGPGRRVALPEVHHALEQAEQTIPDLKLSIPASQGRLTNAPEFAPAMEKLKDQRLPELHLQGPIAPILLCLTLANCPERAVYNSLETMENS